MESLIRRCLFFLPRILRDRVPLSAPDSLSPAASRRLPSRRAPLELAGGPLPACIGRSRIGFMCCVCVAVDLLRLLICLLVLCVDLLCFVYRKWGPRIPVEARLDPNRPYKVSKAESLAHSSRLKCQKHVPSRRVVETWQTVNHKVVP